VESIEQGSDTAEVSKKPPTRNMYVCTYYPNVTDATAASRGAVQPGSVLLNVDVELRPVRTVRVTGRLTNGITGKPAPSGLVGLTPRINSSRFAGGGAANLAVALCSNVTVEVKDPSGRFEFRNVPSGSYWAEGQISGDDDALTGLVPDEVGDTDLEGAVVETGDGAELNGRVGVETGAPFDLSRLSISLGPALYLCPCLAHDHADGAFVVFDLPPATYLLIVKDLPSGYYLKSAHFGGQNVLDADLTLDTGSSGRLDVVLASPGRRIQAKRRHVCAPNEHKKKKRRPRGKRSAAFVRLRKKYRGLRKTRSPLHSP
jgi:hypothetical protein